MTISIARERFTPALLAELRPLILANHAATGSKAPLDPQWDLFAEHDRGEALALVVCRYGDKAVGYAAQAMHEHQFYGERWAICLAIYIDQPFRRYFPDLLHSMEALAEEAGAACVSFNLPPSKAAAFLRSGYQMTEVVVTKRFT